jgi:hypothetical protein
VPKPCPLWAQRIQQAGDRFFMWSAPPRDDTDALRPRHGDRAQLRADIRELATARVSSPAESSPRYANINLRTKEERCGRALRTPEACGPRACACLARRRGHACLACVPVDHLRGFISALAAKGRAGDRQLDAAGCSAHRTGSYRQTQRARKALATRGRPRHHSRYGRARAP